MANEITTDNINTKAQEVASIGAGDYVYIFKTGAQGFSRITADHFTQGGGGSNANKIKNIRDNQEYRLWVGTQAQLEALNGVYESDVIYIVAEEVQGTVVPVTSISVTCTKSSSLPNTYNLVATLSPSNTTQSGVSWSITSGGSYATLSSNGLNATLTVLSGASGNSVVVRCTSTADATVFGSATQSVTYEEPSVDVTITDISVSNTTFPNNKQCTAVFSPSGYSIPVTWSSSNTSVATIDSSTGYLTINSSGTVTIYANSFSKQFTLTYHEEEIPTGELNFTATRTGANTMTLAATKGGSSVNASYSLQGTAPTVKKLQSGVLTDVPAVEISGSTLTYHDDCTVNIVATANGETKTKSITIAHNENDYIWFEDSAVESVLINAGVGNSGGVTYAQASATTTFKINNTHIFSGNTTIKRFNELRLFGITSIGTGASAAFQITGCSSLQCLHFPSTITGLGGNSLTTLTALESLIIDCSPTVGCVSISGNPNLSYLKIEDDAASVPTRFLSDFVNIETVDLGESISALPQEVFRNCGITSLTLRYEGVVSKNSTAFSGVTAGSVDLYVPASQVSAYANYDAAIKEVHAITD